MPQTGGSDEPAQARAHTIGDLFEFVGPLTLWAGRAGYNGEMAAEPTGPVVTLGADPLAGVTIGGRYTLVQKIGEGGMGVVYRGEDTTTRAPVAIKLLLPELGRIGEIAHRFEREAQAMRRLTHPHIVRVID